MVNQNIHDAETTEMEAAGYRRMQAAGKLPLSLQVQAGPSPRQISAAVGLQSS